MEKINLGFSVSNSNSPSRKSSALTLNQTIDLIKNKRYSKDIEERLIQVLKSRPSNSYENFLNDINSHISKIEKDYEKRNKSQN